MRKTNMKIALTKIVTDKEIYPRNDYYWQVAYDYCESMRAGAKFPKIVVANVKNSDAFVLIDGRHRQEAFKMLLGKKWKNAKTDCEVLIGLDKKQMYEEAVRRNITHGKPFSVQEKLNIALKLRDLHYTTARISEIVNIIPSKLSNLIGKKLVNTITGEEIILKKDCDNLVLSQSQGSQKLPSGIGEIQNRFMGRSQDRIIEELIILITTKSLDLKDKKVAHNLKRLKAILNKMKLK